MHREDDDVAEALEDLFENEGIDILRGATGQRISGSQVKL